MILSIFVRKILKKLPENFKSNSLLQSIYRKLFDRKKSLFEKEIVNKLRDIEDYNSEEINKLQKTMLFNMLKYAYENTDYYKALFNCNNINLISIDSFKKIPILNKSIIRKNTDLLLSKKIPREQLSICNTGGSTGEPLEFYSDKAAGAIDNAHHWYLYSLMGHKKNDVIMSGGGHVIPKSSREKNIYWEERYKECVWGEIAFSVLYISDFTIHYYIKKIIEIKPSILRGYPSFYDRLAQYILDHNIVLDFPIKGINLTAEMCSISQRKTIEKAFSSMVYFEYGHTEMCLYCYTNDIDYIYHSSPIYGYIEVLDDDGYDVASGELGNIIVTGLNNYGMPFIRYDTGDMGVLLHKNGGVVQFKKIVGRNQDYILSKDNQKVYLTALIFGQHLRAFKNIIQWQIVQNSIGLIELKIIRGKYFSQDDEFELRYNLEKSAKIDITFKYVPIIPRTKRGKHLFLIQNIKSERDDVNI